MTPPRLRAIILGLVLIGGSLALSAGAPGGVVPQDRVLGLAGGRWLDTAETPRWNTPAMRVPRVTTSALTPDMRDRCGEQIRPAVDAHDRLLGTQGWMLVGARQQFGEAVVVTAALDFDGMCRPLSFQAFVFLGPDFAGTLMPAGVDARTDGYPTRITLASRDEVIVEYARYAESDPLCCPSAVSIVVFTIRRTGQGAVAEPGQVTTTRRQAPTHARRRAGGRPSHPSPVSASTVRSPWDRGLGVLPD